MSLSGIALVTGGAGFIGSHIAAALAEKGARVRVIDDLSTDHAKILKRSAENIDFIKASLADEVALQRALEDVEVVFHEAAIPSVPRSVSDPRATHVACVDATFSLLLGCARSWSAASSIRSVKLRLWRSADATEDTKTCVPILYRRMPSQNLLESIIVVCSQGHTRSKP